MDSRAVTAVVVGVLVLGAGAVVGLDPGLLSGGSYERTTVTLVDEDGSRLATVEARVADTQMKRYTGLSDTQSLDYGEGMLFVHDNEATHAYVMRDMNFPLDIVFVAANGTVTQIHHAPVPPSSTSEGELTRYRGYGKYVLEVPRGYANRTGLDEGDRVAVDGYLPPAATETST